MPDSFGNALGESLADQIGRGSQQTEVLYTAEEQAQDFAREKNRFARAGSANVGDDVPLTASQQLAMSMGYGPLTPEAAGVLGANGYAPKSNDPGVRNPMMRTPSSDPSIPEVQNADGSWTLPHGANPHPITAFNGNQILAGRENPVDYSKASIDHENKVITVQMEMNYQTPSAFNLSAKGVTPEEYDRYVNLANKGIERYWSRSIDLNGEEWRVNVSASNSENGMPIKVANPGPSILGDFADRSFNGYPQKVGTLYYDKSYGKYSDAMFSMTSAHEIGHSVLTNAFGYEWSWGHQATSTMMGKIYENAPMYPTSGEIGLMPYHRRNPEVYLNDILERTIASQNDVKTLIYISGRR